MDRSIFLTLNSSAKPVGPFALATLRIMERASLRPKTAITPFVVGGIGLFYVFNFVPTERKERLRRKQKRVLWDFYDPQGHHEIHM